MSDYLIQGQTLSEIAEAIREKLGISDPFPVSSMAELISSIQGGGGTSGGDELEWNDFVAGNFSVINDVNGEIPYITNYAFGRCNCLTRVNFPAVSFIESHAFEECVNLSVVSLANIQAFSSDYVFTGCTKLMSVYLTELSFVPSTYSTIFTYTPIVNSTLTGSFGSIYVANSMLSSFKEQWHIWEDRIVGI